MILITGATGFMGRHLAQRMAADGRDFVLSARQNPSFETGARVIPDAALLDALATERFDAIVHLAGRAHVLRETSSDPLAEFRSVNRDLTLRLATAAARSGTRRFVFLSSIGVLGQATPRGERLSANSLPAPHNAYARSKLEAEEGLHKIAAETGMGVTILRPPLVYGSGAKGNFASLVSWLRKGIPLPLGAIHNQRSLVGIGNLVDLIVTTVDHPGAGNQTFLVSDGEDLSTTALLRRTAVAMGRTARLLPVPEGLLLAAARMAGKGEMAQRLLGSLQLDIEHTRRQLGWSPPYSVDEGLREAVSRR